MLLLVVILCIPLFSLFHSGFPITHDGQDHIARIANFYINLQNGIFIPRWAPNLNWGYGHPILEFLYPLPSYLASFFHFLGFTLMDSTKTVLGIGMLFSGITMYLWLSSFWSKKASFLSAILYVIAPYRFVEVYVRGDIGENLAFVFIPLVLLYIYKLSKRSSFSFVSFGAIFLSLLITAHNAVSLMMIPIIILYILYKYIFFVEKKYKQQFLLNNFLLLVLGFGLSAFFWVPGLLEAKFTLRNIVTAGVYKNRFIDFSQLLYGNWSYGGTGLFTVQLGIVHWIVLIASLVGLPLMWKKAKNIFWFTAVLNLTCVLAVFLMLPYSAAIWSKILLLQNFQFPWRFLAITTFCTAVIGGLVLQVMSKKFQTISFVVLCISVFLLNKDYWQAKGYIYKPESFYTSIYSGTTDTGESAPIWSVRFMERQPLAPIEIIEGKGTIVVQKHAPTIHVYSMINASSVRVLENTLYFPGWGIYVNGIQTPVQFQDERYRGLMTFIVPQGKNTIQVIFRESKVRLFSDIISGISVGFVILLLILGIIKHKQQ